MLWGDISRCHDDSCPERETCKRWVFRDTGHDRTPHTTTLMQNGVCDEKIFFYAGSVPPKKGVL